MYDIGGPELGKVKRVVHEMFRTKERFKNLGYCRIVERSHVCLVIIGTAPTGENSTII